jgi:hypothetical protein
MPLVEEKGSKMRRRVSLAHECSLICFRNHWPEEWNSPKVKLRRLPALWLLQPEAPALLY